MRVDSDGLRGSGPRFDVLAAGVDGVLSRLTAVLEAEGPCWGGDDVGRYFQDGYLGGARDTRDGLASLRSAIVHIGQSVFDAANAVDAAEDRAWSRFQ
jgi:uncharacterized protein YukE